MILGFKEYFDKEKTKPTYFREKILAGVGYRCTIYIPKLHTIREGNRWKSGDIIHMAYGVRSKNYQQFNKGISELAKVVSVQDISIQYRKDEDWFLVLVDNKPVLRLCEISRYVKDINNGYRCYHEGMAEGLVINDGFNSVEQFIRWFNKDFSGQIIHWTNLRY
jgi:hypothetical protein